MQLSAYLESPAQTVPGILQEDAVSALLQTLAPFLQVEKAIRKVPKKVLEL